MISCSDPFKTNFVVYSFAADYLPNSLVLGFERIAMEFECDQNALPILPVQYIMFPVFFYVLFLRRSFYSVVLGSYFQEMKHDQEY